MGNYILAHDLGTSGNKATLFDQQGKFVKSNVHHYDTHYHGVLRAEQNPEEWWQAICASTRKILSDINPREIAAVVLSGQMQGCLCVNKKGDALHNSLIYCDQRSQAETDFLIEAVGAPKIYQITGHRPSPTYSIEKLMWIKNNHPEIFKRTSFMLQAKEYIIAKLTGEFITEQNDASGTNALDLKALNWCEEILDAAGISKNILPHIYRSTDIVGKVHSQAAGETGLLVGTPVVAGAGDGGCATIGAGSVSPGATYSYLGSSGWTSTTAEEPLDDETMRTFTWAHPIQGYFQLCGSVQTAGNCLKWFVENVLQEVQKTENIYDLVDSAVGQIKPGAEGVIFLPYLMGERTPWW
ncbi:MAG: FGGY family carbohydrate kinase, partial [Sphaerochaetaceae bacterium]